MSQYPDYPPAVLIESRGWGIQQRFQLIIEFPFEMGENSKQTDMKRQIVRAVWIIYTSEACVAFYHEQGDLEQPGTCGRKCA